MDRFRGVIVHPQEWPEDVDYAGKRVVVIGSGATAVTLVPALATAARHVTMLQRSPSYIASMPTTDPVVDLIRRILPSPLSAPVIRWLKALVTQGFYQLSQRRPEFVSRQVHKHLQQQLPPGYDVATHFTPRYKPWDQRFCVASDGDLFKAIRAGKVSVVTDHIQSFTETGVLLESGSEVAADVIVTATGLEPLFMGGIELSVDGERLDLPDRLTYKGVMLEGVPNLATVFGYVNASWTLKCDLVCTFVCRLLNFMRASGAAQVAPADRDPGVDTRPFLDLTSGYVTRSADRFPKQGSRYPWRTYQSYLRDYLALKTSRVDDGVLRFSSPDELQNQPGEATAS
jgi:cation diffusion facilitator CzcD-associated flavoprotein CzcO